MLHLSSQDEVQCQIPVLTTPSWERTLTGVLSFWFRMRRTSAPHSGTWATDHLPPPFKLPKHIIAEIFFSEDLQRCPKHFAFFVRHWWTPYIFPPYRTQEPRYSPSIWCGMTMWYIIIDQGYLSSAAKAGPLGPLRSQILYKSILVHGGQMWYNGDAKEFQTAFSELP